MDMYLSALAFEVLYMNWNRVMLEVMESESLVMIVGRKVVVQVGVV